MVRSLKRRVVTGFVSVFLGGFIIACLLIMTTIGVDYFDRSWRFYQPRTALIQYIDRYEPLYQEMNRACYGKNCTDEQFAVFLNQRERLLANAWPHMQTIMMPNWRWTKWPGEELIDGTMVQESDWFIRDSFVAMVDTVGGPKVAFTACVPIVYWQVTVPDTDVQDSFDGLRCGNETYDLP